MKVEPKADMEAVEQASAFPDEKPEVSGEEKSEQSDAEAKKERDEKRAETILAVEQKPYNQSHRLYP